MASATPKIKTKGATKMGQAKSRGTYEERVAQAKLSPRARKLEARRKAELKAKQATTLEGHKPASDSWLDAMLSSFMPKRAQRQNNTKSAK